VTPTSEPSAPPAPPAPPALREPVVDRDPVVATGSGAAWAAWLRQLLSAGRARLAGAAALVLGALAIGAAALWVFGAIADEVSEGDTAAVDGAVAAALRGIASPALDELARIVSALGSEAVAVLLVVLVGYFAWQRRWGAAASLGLITAGAQLLNNVLKDHFRRPRPAPLTGLIPAQAWSFPSGHAMVAAAFYFFLAYVGWRLLRGAARWVWAGLLVALVLAIDLSRLYLNAHYLTDVVAGNAVGLAWTAAVVGAGNLLALRRRRPDGPNAAGSSGGGGRSGARPGRRARGDARASGTASARRRRRIRS
jgi:undecaprenyl-diphosphatase